MLLSLYIKNYAIIEEIRIDFGSGLTTITGETGAGKSIILGALSLVLGKRADNISLNNVDSKCIIEAEFQNTNTQLKNIFETNELDYDSEIILRREISPNGKSRAFINDSPVNLALLAQIAEYLIDIHSQQQNIYLRDQSFLISLLDKYSENENILIEYHSAFKNFNDISNKLTQLQNQEKEIKAEFDYISFQYKELSAYKLEDIDIQEIENDLSTQENAEEILSALSEINQIIENDDIGLITSFKNIQNLLKKTQDHHKPSIDYYKRFESILIELQDLQLEFQKSIDDINIDPEKLSILQNVYNEISSLFSKHQVNSIDELIAIRNNLEEKINNIENYDDQIISFKNERNTYSNKLSELSKIISFNRKEKGKLFEKKIEVLLSDLGIPKGTFLIEFEQSKEFLSTGNDIINFLFSSNHGVIPQPLAKIASGGEISRLMLSIKTTLSEKVSLPTIIFDEIDTGVSGEIAHKMGNIMQLLARNMQIISITHLPQIASKGHEQFTVEKRLTNNITKTTIRKLSTDERITEIAKLLSGSEITNASIENAKVLLNS
jgi:DNA repair protein RecN (Recombination protein N)